MDKKDKRHLRPVYMSFFITLFTAALLMNVIYMFYFSHNARQMDKIEHIRALDQTSYYIDRYIKEIEDSANMLSASFVAQKLMTTQAQKNYLDYANCAEIFAEYAMTIPGIYRIDLYLQNNNTLVTSYEGVYYDLEKADSEKYEQFIDANDSWYIDVEYAGTEPKLVLQMRNEDYISLIKPVFSKYNGKKVGVLCMSIMLSEIKSMLPALNSDTECIILQYDGKSILMETIPTIGSIQKIEQKSDYSGINYQYYYKALSWPTENINFYLVTLGITAFFAVVFFFIVEISERKMFNPVKQLLEGFEQVENGNFEVRLNEQRNDLFRLLFQSFNHMAQKLEQLVSELSNERIHRNEFKFRLLQMQIRPHFLYNLFNNMIWMVEQKDYDRLEVLIKSTAGYYKTALNSGNKDIMLIENQKQLEYYVGIQKIRFGDCFTYETRLDDEVQYCSIPNLLLQPLVENAIVHGLKKQENCKDHILMSAKAVDNQLVLTVCDDGVGIAPEELEDIRREMEHYEGDGSKYFALVNVTARLHNRYKERASINIDSVVNEGTTVVIRIPMEEVS